MSCAKLHLTYIRDEEEKLIDVNLPCGSWKCEICAKVNAAKMRREIKLALQGWMKSHNYDPALFPFQAKFLTLTLPGGEYRDHVSPAQAEKDIKKAWNKLRNYLTRRFPDTQYIWVDELQPSGYAHLHVILLGSGIAGREILDIIRAFWCGKLHMGNIDLTVVQNLNHAAHYVTKYISKGKTGVKATGFRVYSLSAELRGYITADRKERRFAITPIMLRKLNSDGTLGKIIWEHPSHVDIVEVLAPPLRQTFLHHVSKESTPQGTQRYFWESTE